jgi:Zn-dependent protease
VFGASSIKLLTVRGIRIGVDYSWFIVLFLVIFWLSGYYADILPGDEDGSVPYFLAVASALLFFTSIVLHELGHAFVAMRHGIGIPSINLWMFGGVARMDRDTESAATEFKVAAAGPLVTLVITAACIGLGLLVAGGDEFWAAMRVDSDADTSGALALLAWLASINAFVLAFNLIPAFPLDGGRIARAIAWWRSGDRSSATRFAAGLGRAFSYVFVGGGIFLFLQGAGITGAWLALIGFVLGGAARSATVQNVVQDRIEGIRVGDIMDREPVAIPDTLTLDRANEEFFLRYRWPWFPVVDGGGRFQGILRAETIDSVASDRRFETPVSDLLPPEGASMPKVDDSAPLESILGNEWLRKLGALMAVDAEGRLSGVLTVEQISRALQGALTNRS